MAITTITKDARRGWLARTDIDLGDARLLRIETDKCKGGVSTDAAVYRREDGVLSRTYALYGAGGDFGVRLAISASRATEQAVRSQHDGALRDVDALTARARAHYAPKALSVPV